jgi:hypothetical protein
MRFFVLLCFSAGLGVFLGILLFLFPATVRANEKQIHAAAQLASQQTGTEFRQLIAIAMIESSLSINAIGSQGEIGPWQLHPRVFLPHQMRTLEKQALSAAKYIKSLQRSCRDFGAAFIVCYNMGPSKAKQIFKYRSPFSAIYYKKYQKAYNSLDIK